MIPRAGVRIIVFFLGLVYMFFLKKFFVFCFFLIFWLKEKFCRLVLLGFFVGKVEPVWFCLFLYMLYFFVGKKLSVWFCPKTIFFGLKNHWFAFFLVWFCSVRFFQTNKPRKRNKTKPTMITGHYSLFDS